MKKPRFNETLLQRTYFPSPLALCYVRFISRIHCSKEPLRNRTLPIMIYNRLELWIYLMAQARKPFGYQSVV